MEQEDEACDVISENEVKSAMDNESQLDDIVQLHQIMCRCIKRCQNKKRSILHPWNHEQWLKFLEQDLFGEKKVYVPVHRRIESINVISASLEYVLVFD